MYDFNLFKIPVAQQFARMVEHSLFRVEVDKDVLWEVYLASFPEGSNPIFRERREYDCSCCRQFIRAVGDVVTIIDGQVTSIWDITSEIPAYQAVAHAMATLVKSRPIANLFLHREPVAGTDKNFEEVVDHVLTWRHFFVNIPPQFVCKGIEIGPRLSESRAAHDVLHRSLTELTDDAVNTVLELIAQNSLYRGEEHRHTLEKFRTLKSSFNALPVVNHDAFVWQMLDTTPGPVAKIRNTSIGTLLIDLSTGVDLEEAVRKFESVVAPANYKRPTALVTQAMVEKARKTLEDLNLVSALERRYARLEDINVNDILFADRSARKVLSGDVFDSLATRPAVPKNLNKEEEVPIETFIREILPRAKTVELFLENRHSGNLVSLIAPANPTANNLFKWDNRFSWSYNGDLADSIKERVKRAGGNVTGEVLCRLAWYNYDDLDLHMKEPSGYEIYFGNRLSTSPSGGKLDVDMNAGSGTTREPVENIFYARRTTMHAGMYGLAVHNFRKRETIDVGFEVEFDYQGETQRFAYAKALRDGETVPVLLFKYSHDSGIQVVSSLPSTVASKTLWGLKTQEFQRVNLCLLSPNYWSDRGVGNKHYFFMLEGCRNDGQARGFFNEFLKDELTVHRKVIEMVGAKMRTEESAHQLSGLGFSSTQRNHVLTRIKGTFTRTIKIIF
jgi:hypothetical protein